jgi:hypothetical protein
MEQSSVFSEGPDKTVSMSRWGRIPYRAGRVLSEGDVRFGAKDREANLALAAGIVLAAAIRARQPHWTAPAIPEILGSMPRYAENPRNRKQVGWNHFHIAIYLTHVVFSVSQRLTGFAFNRDRATIRYACARIEDARDDLHLDYALDVLGAALAAHAVAIAGTPVGEGEVRV